MKKRYNEIRPLGQNSCWRKSSEAFKPSAQWSIPHSILFKFNVVYYLLWQGINGLTRRSPQTIKIHPNCIITFLYIVAWFCARSNPSFPQCGGIQVHLKRNMMVLEWIAVRNCQPLFLKNDLFEMMLLPYFVKFHHGSRLRVTSFWIFNFHHYDVSFWISDTNSHFDSHFCTGIFIGLIQNCSALRTISVQLIQISQEKESVFVDALFELHPSMG